MSCPLTHVVFQNSDHYSNVKGRNDISHHMALFLSQNNLLFCESFPKLSLSLWLYFGKGKIEIDMSSDIRLNY